MCGASLWESWVKIGKTIDVIVPNMEDVISKWIQ
jgi:hypothetical protein